MNEIISKDIYVDDCLSGEKSEKKAIKRADQVEIILTRGGFKFTGVNFSNYVPPENLTNDGINISFARMTCFPKEDKPA